MLRIASTLSHKGRGVCIPFSRIREIKIFPLRRRANHWHWSAHPGPPKGTHHDRHDTLGRDAMDAAASGGFGSPDETQAAYGKVVWSWRRDRGVYPFRPVLGW